MIDKSLILYIAIGIGFFYVVTTYVSDIQAEDDRYRNNAYKQQHQYDKYQTTDSVGEIVLEVSELDAAKQVSAWNESPLKPQWLALFPDFSAMKMFVTDHVHGEPLVSKLTKTVDEAEDKYFSGTLDVEGAKRLLGSLK